MAGTFASEERRPLSSDEIAGADATDVIGVGLKKDEQEPFIDAGAAGFGKHMDVKNPTGRAHLYDPHTGIYIDPQTGHVSSLTRNPDVDEESALKHDKASERTEKLDDPDCDHSRMSARIKVHGAPYSASSVRSDETGTFNINNLERVVTSGLTETADLSFRDMAACALGIVDVQTDSIVTIPEPGRVSRSRSTDITELPTTSTLLRKRHIIPDLLDSVEENGVRLEIFFGNVQVFNGVIVDRAEMHEAPVVKLSELITDDPFLLLLIELEAEDGRASPSEEDFLQWMVADLTTDCAGAEVLSYTRMPMSRRDRHRHVFLLFNQQKKPKAEVGVEDRHRFDVHDFTSRHSLGAAVAAVYFESETC